MWLALALLGLAMCGCAKTPEQAVVREKSDRGIEGYQEATGDDTEDVTAADHGAAGNGDDAAGNAGGVADGTDNGSTTDKDMTDDDSTTDKNAANDSSSITDVDNDAQSDADTGAPAMVGLGMTEGNGENALAQKLQAPQIYKASVSSEDDAFSLVCDAWIDVPDVKKVPIYQVTQKEFSQELIDRVTAAFFGDAPVYDSDYLYGRTKQEIEADLNERKSYLASGKVLDYFTSIGFAPGLSEEEAYEILQGEIDGLEQSYQDAPDTLEKTPVSPALAADGDGSGHFSGYVETPDGSYLYRLKQYTSVPMEIVVQRIYPELDKKLIGSVRYYPVSEEEASDTDDAFADGNKTREEMEAETGITKADALQKADGYMEALGLADEFSCKNVQLARGTYNDFSSSDIQTVGYEWQLDYTRDIDGFPVTYEECLGGGLESMESTIEPWCYERICFIIGEDGLLQAEITNLYDVGERRMENVQMLPFPEIADIFEQMMRIQSAGNTYQNWVKYQVSSVTLGYMRIYDPNVDSHTGTLVPVWDFFGSTEAEAVYDGGTSVYRIPDNRISLLTVNAADGTNIDRSLGY